jgi:hypothetical protein
VPLGRALAPREPIVIDELSQIQDVYRRWLQGVLSQEDALFAIGDILQKPTSGAADDEATSPTYAEVHQRSLD